MQRTILVRATHKFTLYCLLTLLTLLSFLPRQKEQINQRAFSAAQCKWALCSWWWIEVNLPASKCIACTTIMWTCALWQETRSHICSCYICGGSRSPGERKCCSYGAINESLSRHSCFSPYKYYLHVLYFILICFIKPIFTQTPDSAYIQSIMLSASHVVASPTYILSLWAWAKGINPNIRSFPPMIQNGYEFDCRPAASATRCQVHHTYLMSRNLHESNFIMY